MPTRFLLCTVLVGILFSACGSGEAATTTPTTQPTQITSTTTSPAVTTGPTTTGVTEPGPRQVVIGAVDRFLATPSYTFQATVTIVISGRINEILVTGRVDGPDRELRTTSGGTEVITRVIGGEATIERDGTTTTVPLRQATAAPSIEVLALIGDAQFTSTGSVTGTLSATDLEASGFGVKGDALVEVTLTTDETIAGYLLTATDGAWTVEADFEY